MRVAIQPASLASADVRQHYRDTIERPVEFSRHADLIEPSVLMDLERLFPEGSAPMWGVLPGKNGSNVGKVSRLQANDYVLFYGKGLCYLAGTVALRWHSRALAQRLWRDNREDPAQTWEHMYALADIRSIEVPIEELRRVLGWNDDAFPLGFNVYDGEKGDRLGELCNLDPSDLVLPPPVADDSLDATDDLDDDSDDSPMERLVARMLRQEQQKLKKRLIELSRNRCALCGLALPPAFLVAAHIKRRSECTNREKQDFDNVAMLACVLGCDSLFEHGYIAVDSDGKIIISPAVDDAPAVRDHVANRLSGRTTAWWSDRREVYFAWHRTHTFRAAPPPATRDRRPLVD